MLKFKYMILILFYLVLCIIDCYFSNTPIVNAIHTGYFTETDILISLHDSSNGYNGLLEMLVVYTLPILLGIYFILEKETAYWVVRHSTRAKYKQIQSRKIILVAVIFSFIHQVIDFIYAIWNLKFSLLIEHSFAKYTILSGVIASLFYIETGFLYQMIRDFVKTELPALLITFIVNYVQYLLIKYYIVVFWIPGVDVMTAFEYLGGNSGLRSGGFTILRSLLIIVCLYLLGQMIFEKKDIMKHEK